MYFSINIQTMETFTKKKFSETEILNSFKSGITFRFAKPSF